MLREDQKLVARLVEKNSKIIDIGCGQGNLLQHLEEEKSVHGCGIEIESENVATAIAKGLSVIQGDADHDLQFYPNKGFDYSIMVMTLQNMHKPKEVLLEALRIAKKTIIVIPNFGHIGTRLYLTFKGRMPVTKQLRYEWYDTPNIHFCTIKDLIQLTKEIGCKIEKSFYTKGKADKCTSKEFKINSPAIPNLFGEKGIFVVSRD